MRPLILSGWLLALVALVAGVVGPGPSVAAELQCAVCRSRITGEYFWVSSPAMAEKQSVCKECNQLEARCSICRIAVNHHGRQLPDGRYLCPADFKLAILDEREALRIYEDARKDVEGILGGGGSVLPGRNIKVSLVDAAKLRQLRQSLPMAHDESAILGLTRSRVRNKVEFEHEIHLANGLGPARLAAVAAHEYTHAWIHENVPSTRRLEGDSVEGFCELVAYKLMTRRNEEVEKKVILANAYTRGQVNAFVQAENSQQFDRIVKWMKTGMDDSLSISNRNQVLVVRTEPTAPLWPPPRPKVTPAPDQLELRGISGAQGRRLALVNNDTLGVGERTRVRVGQTNIAVKCLEVGATFVRLELVDERRTVDLFLRPPSVVSRD